MTNSEPEGGEVAEAVSEATAPVSEGVRPRVTGGVEEVFPTPSQDVVPAVEPVLVGVPTVPVEPEGPVFNLLGTNLPSPSEDVSGNVDPGDGTWETEGGAPDGD
jgi:hypothetical protein